MEEQGMARETTYDRSDLDRRSGLYSTEHWLAWVALLASLVMGILGLLAGFGIIGTDEVSDATGGNANIDEVTGTQTVNWQDGALWLLPAISIGMLAWALHSTEHHAARTVEARDDMNRNLFNTEHWLAWLLGLATIAAAALTLLVGYDVFDNANTAEDGLLWGLSSIVAAALTGTLHTVRHHQMATDEDVIVRLIEERTGPRTTTGVRGERVTER
jgi:hypothetical protein